MINRPLFFDRVRSNLGKLNQSQVDGITHLLDAWEADYSKQPNQFLAYALATAWHETGTKMQPVREGFASTDAGAVAAVTRLFAKGKISTNYALPNARGKSYFGRGLVQLTWESNYLKAGTALGIDLVGKPELALDCSVSSRILLQGMVDGWFTGKKLSAYFYPGKNDPVGARRIINGTDKANLIAKYHDEFVGALSAVPTAPTSPTPTKGLLSKLFRR